MCYPALVFKPKEIALHTDYVDAETAVVLSGTFAGREM